MYSFYEDIPFAVAVVNLDLLTIGFINNNFKKAFNVNENIVGKRIDSLIFLNEIYNEIIDGEKYGEDKKLYEREMMPGKYFNIIIKLKEVNSEIYFYECTDFVTKAKERLTIHQSRMKKDKERLLSISTELKTKCDIIEILRNREKEHLMHLKDVINNISEGLIVIDNKGKFSFCNRVAYNITELPIGENLCYKSLKTKYFIENAEESGEKAEVVYNEFYLKYKPIKNLILQFVDKTTNKVKFIELSSSPILNKEKEVMYTIITLKDVTKAKLHQISAEEQAKFVKDVVNTIDVPIAVVNYPELNYRLVNKKHQEIFASFFDKHIDNENIIGKNINDVLIKNLKSDFIGIINNIGGQGIEYLYSPYTVKDEQGRERTYKLKLIPYKDDKERVVRIHIHGLDITEETNHNRELEKITKMKDEFFTVISHELRTPLTIIYSSLQLAYDIYKDDITENMYKTLARISQNCSRLLKLINNVLDLSKAEAGFLELCNTSFDIVYITEFIVNSVNLYAKSKSIELIFDTNEEEAEVFMDKDKYEKILLNLISNSIKFTPEGGKISVILDIKKDNVSLHVRDEGIGIPDSKIDYIFDRFAQLNTSLSRRAEGTGIGLSLVKKFVELMNGKITVSSKEGEGTEFIVAFGRDIIKSSGSNSCFIVGSNINDKINIEFSDIN